MHEDIHRVIVSLQMEPFYLAAKSEDRTEEGKTND